MDEEPRALDQELPFSPGVGCLISFLIAAIPACLIMGAFVLAVRTEIVLKQGPVREVRIWVIREGLEQGIGISTMKRVSGREAAGEVCYRSNVHYLLWRSLAVDRQTGYCECFEFTNGDWLNTAECPQ